MSTKSQLINQHLRAIHTTRQEAFEEVLELMFLKYWDQDMLKKYIAARIKTQRDEIKLLDEEGLKATQLTIPDSEKKP